MLGLPLAIDQSEPINVTVLFTYVGLPDSQSGLVDCSE